MQKPYIKTEGRDLTDSGLDAQRFRDEVAKVFQQMGIKMPSAQYQAQKSFNNNAFFTAGDHQAFVPKTDDFINAVPGANIVSELNLGVPCRISNLYLKESVNLSATANVVFNGCRFDKVITLSSGAKAQFIDCFFKGSAYVSNAGVMANAYTIGCVRTATPHINVTVIAEVTV